MYQIYALHHADFDPTANRYRHRLPIIAEPGPDNQRRRYLLGSVTSKATPLTDRLVQTAVKSILKIQGVAKVEIVQAEGDASWPS